ARAVVALDRELDLDARDVAAHFGAREAGELEAFAAEAALAWGGRLGANAGAPPGVEEEDARRLEVSARGGDERGEVGVGRLVVHDVEERRHGVEASVEAHRARVGGRSLDAARAAKADHGLDAVDAVNREPAARELREVAARAAAEVEERRGPGGVR